MGNSSHDRGRRSGRGRSRRRHTPRERSRETETRADWKEAVDERIWELRGRLVEIRRDLHRHPELGFEETRTAQVVADHLRDLDLEVTEGIARTGVVGILEGDRPGPTVMYRADMDALPIQEQPKGDYTSRRKGVMHACGHDGHVAIALGIATHLSEQREDLHGTVKFVFQPAEESGGGAREMVEAGVLRNPRVDVAVGLHLDNDLPTGTIGLSHGAAMAASSEFRLVLQGRGGHAASPHRCADPVVAASFLVTALQSIVSRQVDPLKEVVLSVCSMHGGNGENVIPKEVELVGTVRCFDEETLGEILGRIEKMAKGIGEGFGVSTRFQKRAGYPATVNDAAVAGRVKDLVVGLLGEDAVRPARMLGSEDMSYFLREVPGCYFMLGSRNDAKGCNSPHHSPEFDIDEDVLPLGVHLGAAVVLDCLEAQAGARPARRKRAARGPARKAAAPREETEEPEALEALEALEEEPAAVEEERIEEEEVWAKPADEDDFLRTRKRRRRGASRERREALLPEHIGPRARDAEAEALRSGDLMEEELEAEAAPPVEPEEAVEPAIEAEALEEREDRPPARRERRREEPGARRSARREQHREEPGARHSARREQRREEPEARSPDRGERRREETETRPPDREKEPREERRSRRPAPREDRKEEITYLKEGDLVPAHRRLLADKEEEGEEGKGPKKPGALGSAPWLWKGRKSRR